MRSTSSLAFHKHESFDICDIVKGTDPTARCQEAGAHGGRSLPPRGGPTTAAWAWRGSGWAGQAGGAGGRAGGPPGAGRPGNKSPRFLITRGGTERTPPFP